MADALEHAHRQGVIHRDIKPENILLADGEAVLADFGIARALDVAGGNRLTETGLAIGTPTYMSPEQSAGSARVDARSDIYALGCVVYEMLAGQPPFSGPTAQAILARHAMDPVPSLRTVRPTVPHVLGRVVTQALAKVPADRFPSARAFGDALGEAAAARADAPDDLPTMVVAARRGATRRRRWWLAAAVAAVLAGSGVGAAVLARKPAPLEPTRVMVLPFQNRTGDSSLDPLGDVAAVRVQGHGSTVSPAAAPAWRGPPTRAGGRRATRAAAPGARQHACAVRARAPARRRALGRIRGFTTPRPPADVTVRPQRERALHRVPRQCWPQSPPHLVRQRVDVGSAHRCSGLI